MPQMAPISWLILFTLFSLYFMIFNSLNFFTFNYKKNNLLENKNNFNLKIYNKLNWKW